MQAAAITNNLTCILTHRTSPPPATSGGVVSVSPELFQHGVEVPWNPKETASTAAPQWLCTKHLVGLHIIMCQQHSQVSAILTTENKFSKMLSSLIWVIVNNSFHWEWPWGLGICFFPGSPHLPHSWRGKQSLLYVILGGVV